MSGIFSFSSKCHFANSFFQIIFPFSAPESGIFLPREAVYSDDEGYYVLKGSSHAVVRVKGKPYDELHFLVEQGVDEGDTVYVRKSLMQ